MRVQLSNQVSDLINDFGPTLYQDFNEVCVVEKEKVHR
jgi:glycerol-3-phosphate O-acyltransferase/dihydroxyacetone phosphate acyltransferase